MIDEHGRTVCDTCGKILALGEYPFCPHGRSSTSIERDEIPGGLVCENYGPQPITFYSHSERRKYMEAHGLVEKEKFCPMPGTDKDPQGIPNPNGYKDPQTLLNAAELICRNGRQESAEDLGRVMHLSTGFMTNEAAALVQSASRK